MGNEHGKRSKYDKRRIRHPTTTRSEATSSSVPAVRRDGQLYRYSDILDEPVHKLLVPIRGYQDEPLVSIEEAVQPVAHLFQDLSELVWIAKQNCGMKPADSLTQDESAAIYLYTMQFDTEPSFYEVLNQLLRSEERHLLKPWFRYLKLFMTALHKLPSHSQTIFRGIKNVDLTGLYTTGKKFAWWGISSCTSTVDVLKADHFLGQYGTRTLFSIECANGKSIKSHSYFDSEKEIMLMPGTYLEVCGQLTPAPGLHLVQLREIEPPFSLIKSPVATTDQVTVKKQDKERLQETPTNLSSPSKQYHNASAAAEAKQPAQSSPPAQKLTVPPEYASWPKLDSTRFQSLLTRLNEERCYTSEKFAIVEILRKKQYLLSFEQVKRLLDEFSCHTSYRMAIFKWSYDRIWDKDKHKIYSLIDEIMSCHASYRRELNQFVGRYDDFLK